MSIATTTATRTRIELTNEHIWQYTDLDSNAISILHMDRKQCQNAFEFKSRLNEIGEQCECSIKVHGLDVAANQKGVVWIRIQSNRNKANVDGKKTEEMRRCAITLINEFTGNACKEVIIPKLSPENVKKLDEVNESLLVEDELPSSSQFREAITTRTARTNDKINNSKNGNCEPISSSSSSSVSSTPLTSGDGGDSGSGSGNKSRNNVHNQSKEDGGEQQHYASNGRRPLQRSSTENFISSLKNQSTPFGSILAPLSLISDDGQDEQSECQHDKSKNKEVEKTTDLDKLVSRNKKKENSNSLSSSSEKTTRQQKRVYSLDFLLSRAESGSSRSMPSNWRDLSALYPNICFSGKVISYFNPHKYHEHWIRVQNQNPDWHQPIAWVQRHLGPALAKQIRTAIANSNNNNSSSHQQQAQQQETSSVGHHMMHTSSASALASMSSQSNNDLECAQAQQSQQRYNQQQTSSCNIGKAHHRGSYNNQSHPTILSRDAHAYHSMRNYISTNSNYYNYCPPQQQNQHQHQQQLQQPRHNSTTSMLMTTTKQQNYAHFSGKPQQQQQQLTGSSISYNGGADANNTQQRPVYNQSRMWTNRSQQKQQQQRFYND